MRNHRRISAILLAAVACLFLFDSTGFSAGKNFEGKWQLTVTIPAAPGTKDKRTLVLNVDAGPRGDSLHGRMTITDDRDRVVGGVWRQVGKRVSITFELPCSEGEYCA